MLRPALPLLAAPLFAAALVLSGCAGLRSTGPPLSARAIELAATPFFPQEAYQCGPAALATVLVASGIDVTPDALTPEVYLPERRGSLQVELSAAARRHGRLAVELVDPGLDAVITQLDADRPVLVLQNLGVSFYPVWHYAVVVGYQPEPERFVLRSGTERRALMRRGRFEATWRRGGHWALVVLRPGADPAGLPPAAYLRAAADLESTGAHEAALAAFRAAARTWPGQPLAELGVANNLYYLGRRDAAAAAYRELLERHPGDPVAVHNLAMLLLEQGRPCEARALLDSVAGAAGELLETARKAVAAAPARCVPR